MLRYYTTSETRQALIDASNRLLARRAALHAARTQHPGAGDGEAPAPERDDDPAATDSESAFARLVADLQATSFATAGAAVAAEAR